MPDEGSSSGRFHHVQAGVVGIGGRVAPAIVNVDNDIGTKQMDPSQKKVITMDVTRKHVNIGAAKIFNTTLLLSRVIGLQASSRETIDIQNSLMS